MMLEEDLPSTSSMRGDSLTRRLKGKKKPKSKKETAAPTICVCCGPVRRTRHMRALVGC